MSDQFVAEIRIFPFNFPPTGWAFCDGQLMPISQNTALFSLLGTTYGGDGKSTFALPDLQGNAPMQPGQGQGLSLRDLGEMSGVESDHAARDRDSGAHARAAARRAMRATDAPGRRARLAGSTACDSVPAVERQPGADGVPGAASRGRRPAAQQHAAVPDAQLLHRAAGHFPAADRDGGRGWSGRSARAAGRYARTTAVPAAPSTPSTRERGTGHRGVGRDEQKAAFVQMQFDAQHAVLPASTTTTRRFDVILVDGAARRAALRCALKTDEIRIVDIALLPELLQPRNRHAGCYGSCSQKRGAARQAAPHPRRALQPRAALTSGSGSRSARTRACICSSSGARSTTAG